MRENLSLLSFWGIIFSLLAVTVFVFVYMYKNNATRGGGRDMVADLRRTSVAVYLTPQSGASADISNKLRDAGDEIERLRASNTVMFWLIIAMNTVVIGLLILAYKIF